MPGICSIFTHFANADNTLTCLRRLADQKRRPEHIVIINNGRADDPVLAEARSLASQHLPEDCLHILQMPGNLGNAGGCASGLDFAFHELKADAVWILDDDSWPRPHTLQALLAAPCDDDTVRMSLVIDPKRGDELSWPLTIPAHEGSQRRWVNAVRRAELPAGNIIASRGGWLGALYPRRVWQRVGTPTPELFIRGEDEEYPWKVRAAGFRFVTVRDSELEHPSAKLELLHFHIGGRSYFYEPGLADSRLYYKIRNWAWLQRLKHPGNPLHRLIACGFYALLTINAMLRTDEVSLRRIYTLFRALHNGFYGKLRPW